MAQHAKEMREHFTELFEYNTHCNQKLIALMLQNLDAVPEKTQKLMHHLINAQQIWNSRIRGTDSFDVWQLNDWNAIDVIDKENQATTLDIIETNDLKKVITYSNSKGIQFTNRLKDVLFHVINHSTYHRAQIATDLKQIGIEPINTDYIFYKREKG